VILECYDELIKSNFYLPFGALLGSFNTYSRFSGPREAVFTAICRKNYGCSHFIVGRDHTGVSDYYNKTESQEIFDKIDTDMVIIKPVEVGYDLVTSKYLSIKENDTLQELSGSIIRKFLLENHELPNYLVRENISRILKNIFIKSPDKLFES